MYYFGPFENKFHPIFAKVKDNTLSKIYNINQYLKNMKTILFSTAILLFSAFTINAQNLIKDGEFDDANLINPFIKVASVQCDYNVCVSHYQ